MGLVFEAHHGCYLFDALAAVTKRDLSRTHDFIADQLVRSLAGKPFADTRKVLWRDVEQTCVFVNVEIGLRRVVKMLHELP